MRNRTEIIGMRELQETIRQIGQLPQKTVTKAARKGSNIVRASAKQNAPVDTGHLKQGIVLKPERSSVRGKKVFQIVFNPAMNDIFVKISKAGKRSYYPASQEYGYFARSGRYIPGYRFMRNSADQNKSRVENTMIQVLTDELDKLR